MLAVAQHLSEPCCPRTRCLQKVWGSDGCLDSLLVPEDSRHCCFCSATHHCPCWLWHSTYQNLAARELDVSKKYGAVMDVWTACWSLRAAGTAVAVAHLSQCLLWQLCILLVHADSRLVILSTRCDNWGYEALPRNRYLCSVADLLCDL
jgi:hypothetical protein